MVTRGTTPALIFTTPYDADMVTSGYITFTLRGDIILDIPTDDENVIIEDNKIIVKLTQAQTLLFAPKSKNMVQLRLVLADGSVVASNIVTLSIGDILKDGEI